MPWWTVPTFNAGYVVGASDFNEYLRDNENYLLAGRPNGWIVRQGSADYTTTSTTFVDVDAANLILTMTLNGSRALITATGTLLPPVNNAMYLDVIVDGVARAGGTNGVLQAFNNNNSQMFMLQAFFSGLQTGVAHTFKLQYRTATGTATLYNNGVPITMFGLEV